MNRRRFIKTGLLWLVTPPAILAATPQQQLLLLTKPPQAPVAGGGTETIGYTGTGTPAQSCSNASIRYFGYFTPAHSGNVTSFSLYSINSSATNDFRFGVYTAKLVDVIYYPDALVGSDVEFVDVGTWTEGWKDFTGTSIAVTAGVKYFLAVQPSATYTAYQVASGDGINHYFAETHTYGALPASANSGVVGAYWHSIKATITY